jgi:hypothetical protein
MQSPVASTQSSKHLAEIRPLRPLATGDSLPLPKGATRPCTVGHCGMCRRTLPLEVECVGCRAEPQAIMSPIDSRQIANTINLSFHALSAILA